MCAIETLERFSLQRLVRSNQKGEIGCIAVTVSSELPPADSVNRGRTPSVQRTQRERGLETTERR